MPYLIADEPNGLWGHPLDGTTLVARFAFDTDAERMVVVQLRDADGSWVDASDSERSMIESAIVEDNREAFEAPEAWGLVSSENIPHWAEDLDAAPGMR